MGLLDKLKEADFTDDTLENIIQTFLEAGWRKPEPLPEDFKQELMNRMCCLSYDNGANRIISLFHDANWRRVPPEGEGPECALESSNDVYFFFEGCWAYRHWLLAQEEK